MHPRRRAAAMLALGRPLQSCACLAMAPACSARGGRSGGASRDSCVAPRHRPTGVFPRENTTLPAAALSGRRVGSRRLLHFGGARFEAGGIGPKTARVARAARSGHRRPDGAKTGKPSETKPRGAPLASRTRRPSKAPLAMTRPDKNRLGSLQAPRRPAADSWRLCCGVPAALGSDSHLA